MALCGPANPTRPAIYAPWIWLDPCLMGKRRSVDVLFAGPPPDLPVFQLPDGPRPTGNSRVVVDRRAVMLSNRACTRVADM